MRRNLGYILMGIAILHEIVGVIVYRDVLIEIMHAGIFNTINPPHWDRDATFWFLMFGIMLFFIGWNGQWFLDHINTIPRYFGMLLLIICCVGLFLMPASGFWLAVPIAIWILRMPEASNNQLSSA